MSPCEIVAHRGATAYAPENTLEAFERAVELGADWIELDVRLTRDRVAVVYHYFYMHVTTPLPGPIFDYSWNELRDMKVSGTECRIPLLSEVLEQFAGRIGLEIELKGPEAEAVDIVSKALYDYRQRWGTFAVTSFEPSLLLAIQQACPELDAALIYHPESWMAADVIAYDAVHRAQLAGTRTVHLLPQHISSDTLDRIHAQGVSVRCGPANDSDTLRRIIELGITRICTDSLDEALALRLTSYED